MKLGLMSDLHGNSIALREVLADAASQGVERWWVLGDVVALGPDPVGVLDILSELSDVSYVAGNTERYVLTGDRPRPSFDDVTTDPTLLPVLVEVAASFAWTRGMLTQAGRLPVLDAFAPQLRITLPDGTRVLGVHASPLSDDGEGIDSTMTDERLGRLLEGCEADLVFAGHTHDATDRRVGFVRAVNLGSVSNSHRADRCATYAILHTDNGRHRVEQRVVAFDCQAVLDQLQRVRHPAIRYLSRFFT